MALSLFKLTGVMTQWVKGGCDRGSPALLHPPFLVTDLLNIILGMRYNAFMQLENIMNKELKAPALSEDEAGQ